MNFSEYIYYFCLKNLLPRRVLWTVKAVKLKKNTKFTFYLKKILKSKTRFSFWIHLSFFCRQAHNLISIANIRHPQRCHSDIVFVTIPIHCTLFNRPFSFISSRKKDAKTFCLRFSLMWKTLGNRKSSKKKRKRCHKKSTKWTKTKARQNVRDIKTTNFALNLLRLISSCGGQKSMKIFRGKSEVWKFCRLLPHQHISCSYVAGCT